MDFLFLPSNCCCSFAFHCCDALVADREYFYTIAYVCACNYTYINEPNGFTALRINFVGFVFTILPLCHIIYIGCKVHFYRKLFIKMIVGFGHIV